jgi:flagellar protein FliO/FliZ
VRACEGVPGPSQTSETRAARGATTEHGQRPCEEGATKRCEAERSSRRREGTPSPALPPRLGLHSGARARLALAGGVLLCVVLALAPGPFAPSALRAAAAACAVGGAALLARASVRRAAPSRLALVARQALSREAGVALLELDGRPVLVGFGAEGVRLLETAAAPDPGAPRPREEER